MKSKQQSERDWALTWQQILDAGWTWQQIGKHLGVQITDRMALAYRGGVAPPERFTARVLTMLDAAPKKRAPKKAKP